MLTDFRPAAHSVEAIVDPANIVHRYDGNSFTDFKTK